MILRLQLLICGTQHHHVSLEGGDLGTQLRGVGLLCSFGLQAGVFLTQRYDCIGGLPNGLPEPKYRCFQLGLCPVLRCPFFLKQVLGLLVLIGSLLHKESPTVSGGTADGGVVSGLH